MGGWGVGSQGRYVDSGDILGQSLLIVHLYSKLPSKSAWLKSISFTCKPMQRSALEVVWEHYYLRKEKS